MPQTEAVEQSCALLATGWGRIGDHAPGSAIAWGVNRHGQWETARVHLAIGEKTHVYYLGTSLTFGPFSAASKVLTRDGSIATIKHLSEVESLSEIWMEMPAVELASEYGFDPSEDIISALEHAATSYGKHEIAVKCRSLRRRAVSRGLVEAFRKKRIGSSYFFIFNRQLLVQILEPDWLQTFDEVINLLFSDGDNSVVLDRTESLLICYRVARSIMLGISSSLIYDGLQTTRLVRCTDHKTYHSSRMSSCKCAFATSEVSHSVQMEWTDRTWNPVLNHLIMA